MLAADRAFDKLSGERGTSAAFLEFPAESAVVFRPGPVDARNWFLEHPSPPGSSLRWHPLLGEVSFAGDLGYTIGFYESTRRSGDSPLIF
jgi:hypothetical protein